MRFSIGIPAFKSKFFIECLNSVLAQTNKDFEVIIINDNSPDNFEEILSLFNDSRIKYFRNPVNVGAENVVDNWNSCLDKSSGDFFLLLGDDDILETNYLDEFDKLIHKFPSLNVYHCRSFIINDNSEIVSITPSWPERETLYENMWHRIKSFRDQFISDFVYHTETLKKNGGFFKLPLAWASDDISSYIAMRNIGIAHTNQPLLRYRRNAINISSTGKAQLKMDALVLEIKWYKENLNTATMSEEDFVILSELPIEINKYFNRKKNRIIVYSFEQALFKNLIFWTANKITYKLSLSEILYGLIEFVKKVILKRKYASNQGEIF